MAKPMQITSRSVGSHGGRAELNRNQPPGGVLASLVRTTGPCCSLLLAKVSWLPVTPAGCGGAPVPIALEC